LHREAEKDIREKSYGNNEMAKTKTNYTVNQELSKNVALKGEEKALMEEHGVYLVPS
jgi:hypothetical protein